MVKYNINKILIIWTLLIALFAFLTTTLGNAAWIDGLIFFVFQNLFILIPGMGILMGINLKISSKLELVSLGYATGFAVNIITYYLIMLTGIKEYAVCVLCFEALVAVIVLYRRKSNWIWLSEDSEGNLVCGIILCALLLCRFIVYFSVNKIPSEGEANFYTADLMYYIGNSIEMAKEYPTMDFRWHTQFFKYNVFGNAQMALMQMTMDLPMTVLEFSYGFIQTCILLVFSFYSLFKHLALNIRFCMLGLISALFTSGWEGGTFCTYMAHIFIVPFGFDIAIAYMTLSILCYTIYVNEKRADGKTLILLLLFLAVCTGSKAPIAIVLMGAFGLHCAYRFLIKHLYKSTLIVGISLLITFIFIFFGIASDGFDSLNGNGNSLNLELLRSMSDSRAGSGILSMLPTVIPTGIKYPITVPVYMALCIPGLGMLLGLLPRYIKKINRDIIERYFVFINIIIVGIIFGLITSQNGYSQIYFFFAVIPAETVLLMKVLEELYSRQKRGVSSVITMLILLLGVFSFFQYRQYYKTGIENLLLKRSNVWSEEQANLVTYDEYEAYSWIRDNTDEKSLLASNVILQSNQGRSFVTGAFSERHLWLEGWEYGYAVRTEEEVSYQKDIIARVMENDLDAVSELINNGVDYLIQIKRVSPDFALDMQYGQLVFENDSVCIYSIQNKYFVGFLSS